jgi:hypothetical protein|nr:MAG TPA: hypothetical protein [Caudoviricetes sp.]
MKIITNYKNFDIKVSKLGNYFAYSDIGLSDYMYVKLGKYSNVEDAKRDIDMFWQDFDDTGDNYNY